MAEAETWPRRLNELRVAELKLQLERRGLESKGVKAVLLERLQQALLDEDIDPEKFIFDCPPPAEKRTPTKRLARTENVQETDFSEDLVVEEPKPITKETPIPSVIKESPDKPTTVISESRNSVIIKKREAEELLETSEAKKVCKDDDNPPVEDSSKNSDFNGLDGDDSINIDIGDEDFLNEDGEQGTNGRKDERLEAQGAAEVSCQNAGEEKQSVAAKQEADESVQDDKKQETPPADATGNEDSKIISGETNTDQEKQDKEVKKPQSTSSPSRNLWVSGLSRSTRATDLKQVCSAHGKVIGAKIVVNARSPGSRCYGYVTMATPEDAQNCIKRLHKTDLHGRIISVEKAKSDNISGGVARKEISPDRSRNRSHRSPRRTSNSRKKSSQEKKDAKNDDKSDNTTETKEGDESKVDDKDKKDTASGDDSKKKDSTSQKGNDGQERRPPRDFIPFEQIIRERDEKRANMREWHRRGPHRGIHKQSFHHRPDKYRQRMEMDRIAIERKKLRIERERVEREKMELQRLERERQKLERVRLDVERLELKRAQMRLEEERSRAAAKRNYFMGPGSGASVMSRSKDPMPISSYERSSGRGGPDINISTPRFNMPPPPYVSMSAPYEMSMGSKSDRVPPPRDRRDFNRDYSNVPRHAGSGNQVKYSSNGGSYELRQPLPPGTRPRDQRIPSNNNHSLTRRSPKPGPRDHYSDSSTALKGDSWSNSGSGADSAARYGSSITSSGPYAGESRYPSYQPAPPGIR